MLGFCKKAPQRKRDYRDLAYAPLVLLAACGITARAAPPDPTFVPLNDQPVLTEIAINAETVEERVAAIAKLTSEDILVRIFEQARTFHERSVAANRIGDETWLTLNLEPEVSPKAIVDVFAPPPEEPHARLSKIPRLRELEQIHSIRSSYLEQGYIRFGWIIADLALLLRSEPTDSPLATLALNYEGKVERRELADFVEVTSRGSPKVASLPYVTKSKPFSATVTWYYYALGFFDKENPVVVREWETQIGRDMRRRQFDKKNHVSTAKPPIDYRDLVKELFDKLSIPEHHLTRIATTSPSLLGREAALLKLGDGDLALSQMHQEWEAVLPKQVYLFRVNLTEVLDDIQRVIVAKTDFGPFHGYVVSQAAVMGIKSETTLKALIHWSEQDDAKLTLSDGEQSRLKERGRRWSRASPKDLKRPARARLEVLQCSGGGTIPKYCLRHAGNWGRQLEDDVR